MARLHAAKTFAAWLAVTEELSVNPQTLNPKLQPPHPTPNPTPPSINPQPSTPNPIQEARHRAAKAVLLLGLQNRAQAFAEWQGLKWRMERARHVPEPSPPSLKAATPTPIYGGWGVVFGF